MNKWKIAFWSCLTFLVIIIVFSTYLILDQGVTLTYQKEGFTAVESDLGQLAEIINETDLSKDQIENKLKGHKLYRYMNFTSDTISLHTVSLVFVNRNLKAVTKE